jgi:ferrochelatase
MSTHPLQEARTGVLVCNLGTPEAPDRKSVGRFLREFLSDPRVVDLPRWLWIPLLYGVIVPLRASRSAAAYREIWWPEGSPLLILTERLTGKLALALNEEEPGTVAVAMGMRYGEPSIFEALKSLQAQGVQRLVVLPLYPQFSGTTTASIFDAVDAGLAELDWQPGQSRIEEYSEHPQWIRAVAASIRDFRAEHGAADRLMFSLHGIPQRYADKGDPYPGQCEAGVMRIAQELGLADGEWMLCYQSRVGREPWLQPYTDKTLEALGEKGLSKIQVVCPGFSVDCLETLEEIAQENRENFIEAGGGDLEYIPALNDSDRHVQALASIIREAL